jgi:hypothetical protein
LNIYHVKFWIIAEFDENGNVVEDPEDGQETISERVDGGFDLGSVSLPDAYLEAAEYLDEAIGEEEYEVTSISEREDIQIINWPGDNEECQCDSCRTERAAPEDRITFKCIKCGYDITIVDDFKMIKCPNCRKEISRDRIIGSGTNYLMLDIDGDNKEDKK